MLARRIQTACSLALSLCCMTLFSSHARAQQAGLTTLAAQKNQTRPLLIFAPKPDDPQMGIQLRSLNLHAAAVQERQIAVIALPYGSPSPSPLQLSDSDAEAARRRFQVAPTDFAVILIGKDGGVKLRSSRPLSIEKLNETIDAMPMRKDEMQGKPSTQ